MIPRALAKKKKLEPHTSTLPIPDPPVPSPTSDDPTLSSSVNDNDGSKVVDKAEAARSELILANLENVLSDWGLSFHEGNGILHKLRESEDGYIHLQQLLAVPRVRVFADSQVDLQKAIKSRPSAVLKLSKSGFQVARQIPPDFEKLLNTTTEEWESMSLYLESIPAPSSSNAFTLTSYLSSLLSTQIQCLVLPPAYDPLQPQPQPSSSSTTLFRPNSTPNPDPDATQETGTETAMESQSTAFLSATETVSEKEKKRKKEAILPACGGSFRGFGFVVVGSKEDAERLVQEWQWDGGGTEEKVDGTDGVDDDEEEDEDMVEGVVKEKEEETEEGGTSGEKNAEETSSEEKKKAARASGFRILPYTEWITLKNSYLTYRDSLNLLVSHAEQTANSSGWAQSNSYSSYNSRRDQSYHQSSSRSSYTDSSYDRDRQGAGWSGAAGEARTVEKWGHDRHRTDERSGRGGRGRDKWESNGDRDRDRDRGRGRNEGSGKDRWRHHDEPPHTRPTSRTNPPSKSRSKADDSNVNPTPIEVDIELRSEEAREVEGAYPKNCVLWVRGIHEKSTKNGLKVLFGTLLDELEEGSGLGVQFVDYEKGLDTCHVRLASAHLANLVHTQLNSTPTYQTEPSILSSSPPVEADRPQLVSHILEGARERIYWEKLPETTRAAARKSAGGVSSVVREQAKKRRRKATDVDEEEVEWQMRVLKEEQAELAKEREQETEANREKLNSEGSTGERKRKRPSGKF